MGNRWEHGHKHGDKYEDRATWVRESSPERTRLCPEYLSLTLPVPIDIFLRLITWGDRDAYNKHDSDNDLMALADWYDLRVERGGKIFGSSSGGFIGTDRRNLLLLDNESK